VKQILIGQQGRSIDWKMATENWKLACVNTILRPKKRTGQCLEWDCLMNAKAYQK
jgi:hypothetical protein